MVLGLTVYGAHDVPQPGGWAAVQLWASESHSVPQRDNPRPQLQGLEGQFATSVLPPDSILPGITPSFKFLLCGVQELS